MKTKVMTLVRTTLVMKTLVTTTLGTAVLAAALFNSNPMLADEFTVKTDTDTFAALPYGVTSFGAARVGDGIYVYGGHTGSAHTYSANEQSNELLKLDLNQPRVKWHVVSKGRRLQGLALVAHGSKLFSIGGFQAKNDEGEEHDLHSQPLVTAYDTETGKWSELPPLPAGRSSHDAAVLEDTIYVVGGWDMNSVKSGDEVETETKWHTSALSLDLAQDNPQWRELPPPPFQRRALSVAAHAGKIFVIGGMQREGGPTRDVAVYDPANQAWLEGPALLGDNDMVGFGASAWSIDGQLVVSCYNGDLQLLSSDGSAWRRLGKTQEARFFHRLLPLDTHQLISVGGANMESGKFLIPERIVVQ